MDHDVTVYLTAAWRHDDQRGPLRYSATTGGYYGTPNCETFWEAVGELVRELHWCSCDADSDESLSDHRALRGPSGPSGSLGVNRTGPGWWASR